MSRDRGLALIRQAHVEGRIDLGKAAVLDRDWQLKLWWTLDWVEADNLNRVAAMRHDLSCAAMLASPAGVLDNWEVATKLQDLATSRLFPWLDPTLYGQARDVAIRRLASLWAARFGDPADPAVAARIQKTADALLAMARANRQGDAP